MKPLVIKLGGAVLDTPEALIGLFVALASYKTQKQRPLVIVHGGGCVVDELMAKLSLPVKKINGLRVTPADQIAIITGALAGTANKTLLAWAVKYQLNAIGLSLADGSIVNVTPISAELGHVANASAGNPALLQLLLTSGYLPIVSSIGITATGELMNVNADQAATAIAASLDADLVLLADVSGILDGNKQLIREMSREYADQLITERVITDGMVIKVTAALDAAQALGRAVDIASWRDADKLGLLFDGTPIGTRIIG